MCRKLTHNLFILSLLLASSTKAQDISWMLLDPSVPRYTDSVKLIVATFYTFGGGGQGPRAENPSIKINNDTIVVMGHYNFGGFWQGFMSGSIDTIELGKLDTNNYTLIYHLTSYNDYTYDTTFSIATDTLQFYVTKPFSISESSGKNDLKIYPNPSDGLIKIEGLISAEEYEIVVRTVLGNTIYREKITSVSTISMDLSSHPTGNYFITVSTKDGIWQQKCTLAR